MQCLQGPNHYNADNLKNVRREASSHFRKAIKEYRKANIDELETSRRLKNIKDLCRGMSDFKKGYQPRSDIVND